MSTLREVLIQNCDFWRGMKLIYMDEDMLNCLKGEMTAIKAVLQNPKIGDDPPGTHKLEEN